MTIEHVFTPAQQKLLDQIEEIRRMAVEPIKKLIDAHQEVMDRTQRMDSRFEELKCKEKGITFDPHKWQPSDWQVEKLSLLMFQYTEMNMRFAKLTSEIYAIAPVTITMTTEEFASSPLSKDK